MKTSKILIMAAICMFWTFNSLGQNYFNTSNKVNVWSGGPSAPAGGSGNYFGLTQINNQYLTVPSCENSRRQYELTYYRSGDWTSNNGNGTFSGLSTYYTDEPGNSDIRHINGMIVLDGKIALIKQNEMQVHLIQNGGVSSVYQDIPLGFGNYVDAGSFDYLDNVLDAVVTDGSQVKIFRNNGSGFDMNPFSFSIPCSKLKLKQMTDKADGYPQNNANDRADLIFVNGTHVIVYANNNNNGFNTATPFANINVGYAINDIEVGDVTGDGYNDIVVSGGAYPNFTVQVYVNVQGTLINSNPAWYISGNAYLSVNPLVTMGDINKDGYNDLVVTSNEGFTSLFLNKYPANLFNSTPDQNFYALNPYEEIYQIKVGDIYNKGGMALIVSYRGTATEYYGIKAVNATNYDPPPSPAPITGKTFFDGTYYRPHIFMNNTFKERDFARYDIYKYSPNTNGQIIYLTQTTADDFVDYTEYMLSGNDSPWWNCYYYVKQVDQSSQVSAPSNYAYYTVAPQPICLGCGSDNKSTQNVEPPKEFKVSNFPNPFNPTTNIYFALPKPGQVKITVYDMLGRVVKELLNEYRGAGMYVTEFNAENLASGIYYYRIEAGSFIATKKMMLIK
jgi:hypothetical protein